MLAGQNEIRSRIEDLKVSHAGYKRQLGSAYTTEERRARLEFDLGLLEQEIGTLEKIAQLGAAEPDRTRIEEVVRERLETVRSRLAADPALEQYSTEERELTSGEARGLVWALGEEAVSQRVREMVAGREHADPNMAARNLPGLLMRTLQNGPSADARASAAYEIGRLGIAEAVPRLVSALEDEQIVSELAFDALCRFTDQQLAEAEMPQHIRDQIRAARSSRGGN